MISWSIISIAPGIIPAAIIAETARVALSTSANIAEQRAIGLGLAHELERRARHDSGGAFGADHRAHQVVAAALLGRAAELDDLAVGQHQLDAQHVIGGDAVFERMRAAGVFRDIAADRAGDLRRRIGRVEIAARP